MSKKSNPAMIGGFVIGAITLLVIGVTVFGSGRFFRETYKYILYFESDVSGLSVGANVKLKGVKIGTVSNIMLSVGDMAALSDPRDKFYVPVIIELDADQTSSLGVQAKPDPPTVAGLVMRGLRGQLASESLVTGVMYVKLDLFPGTKGIRLADEVAAPYPEIPTLQTPLEQVTVKAAQFFAELQAIDVKGLVEEIKAVAAAAKDIVATPGLRKGLDSLDDTMASLQKTLDSLSATSESARDAMEPLRKEIEPTMIALREAAAQVRGAADSVGTVMQPDSPLIVALQRTLEDAQGAVKTINDVAALLERQPDVLLKGRGPREEAR